MRFSRNCFGRGRATGRGMISSSHAENAVSAAGFTDVWIEPLNERTDADAAIAARIGSLRLPKVVEQVAHDSGPPGTFIHSQRPRVLFLPGIYGRRAKPWLS